MEKPKLDLVPIPLIVPSSDNSHVLFSHTSGHKKPRRYFKNKVVPLINEFYDLFYSYRNLTWKEGILVVSFFVAIGFAIVITFKFQKPNSDLKDILLSLSYAPAIILYFIILNRHEKNIVDNYNATYHTDFYSIVEAQKDWLTRNFGVDYQPSELIKKFEEWYKWREAYPPAYKFQWLRYIYNKDAKARIMSSTTAFLALVGVLLFNIYKFNDPEPVIDQLIINFFYLSLLSFLAIIPLFLMLIFSRDLLKNLFYSFFDFLNKDEFTETKYKKFMAFLVNQLQIN